MDESPADRAEMGPLYQPPSPESSRALRFLRHTNAKHSLSLSSYLDLYNWSIDKIDDFWSEVWDETAVVGDKGAHVVDTTAPPPANPLWFTEAKLNYAENLLKCRSPDKTALIEAIEPDPNNPSPPHRRVTYLELYSLVADLVSALLASGLKAGDRVASYSSNCIENVAACLAAAAIGCIWVSAAADFGPEGVLERFEQVRPSLIFSVDAVVYNAKVHPHLPKLKSLLVGLQDRAALRPKVVVIPHMSTSIDRSDWHDGWISWDEFVAEGKEKKLGRTPEGEIEWCRLDFNWPLWILFSSGTTGRPKPIVHRAGGMLLQAKKEFVICADLQPEDVFFYYTTTGWMMWNFLIAGLSVGCTLVLYDGSPLYNPAYLWHLVDELEISIFGTSAKYIDQLSKVYKPADYHQLSTLRHIYSTGSPLAPPLFDFVYKHIRPDVLLGSITGGTDICSLFAGMCTALPVFRGEIQCRLLGMAVEVFTPSGTIAAPDEAGELVCLKPFPCMPVGFWPLPGFGSEEAVEAAKMRYQQAYFSEFKDVWFHGDHVILTRSRAGNGGGLIMLGRSDGVLNPGGVRFGSAEVYDVIDLCFAPATSHGAHAIVDSLVIGQGIAKGADERVILFIKLLEGQVLSAELEKRIKAEIRVRRSARHVPARVQDIPYTVNLKRVEVPVKKIINGAPISSINPATLKNPGCLAEYEALGIALRAEV
ncbi:Malonamoyl-CoA synthetase vrtB [Sparassis crispa]|uniref:Malonamoyl-CoA synthetase vrtB n=1 Tax=Sparassis crispa TaxID=139825 RepID=A0A401GBB5_9APHY|nr:Malonamoyl-CoA synthetase vrtB [Sparassis crispa]GBE79455.1 Malonamoyl-CoA synthetase vrtB [Sparassis crispa]